MTITDAQRKTACAYASAQKGKPYQFGQTGPNAFDCSGLVLAAWRAAGVALPHNSEQQAEPWLNPAGRFVPWTQEHWAETKVGDLIVYYNDWSHIGIYVGNGLHSKFLVAQATNEQKGCEVIYWDAYAVPVGIVFMGH